MFCARLVLPTPSKGRRRRSGAAGSDCMGVCVGNSQHSWALSHGLHLAALLGEKGKGSTLNSPAFMLWFLPRWKDSVIPQASRP